MLQLEMCTCPHRFDFSYMLDLSGLTYLLCLFVSGLCQRQWGLTCWRLYLRVPQMEEPRRCLQLFEIGWVFLYDSYEFFTLSACLRLVALLDWLWSASQIEEFALGSFWLAYGTRLWNWSVIHEHVEFKGISVNSIFNCMVQWGKLISAMWTTRFSFFLGSRWNLAFHGCHSKGVFATEIPSSANCHLLNSSLFCNGPAHKCKMQVFTTWLVLEHMQLNNYKRRPINCQLHGWITCYPMKWLFSHTNMLEQCVRGRLKFSVLI
jgi:hypothetical protein